MKQNLHRLQWNIFTLRPYEYISIIMLHSSKLILSALLQIANISKESKTKLNFYSKNLNRNKHFHLTILEKCGLSFKIKCFFSLKKSCQILLQIENRISFQYFTWIAPYYFKFILLQVKDKSYIWFLSFYLKLPHPSIPHIFIVHLRVN